MILRPLWFRQPQPARDTQMLTQINTIADTLVNVSDAELTSQCHHLKLQSQYSGDDRDEVTVRAFALTYESVRRVLGLTYFPEQLLAGLAMIHGEIVEMQTGEGKTITAVLPACWFALTGCGVHVMTVNDYLAERDFTALSPVYERLGFTVALNQPGLSAENKRNAYEADFTYGPGYEFGFDYLRDQIAISSQKRPRLGSRFSRSLYGITSAELQPIQRAHTVAIVDEADSVMIDEATVPLVLSSQQGKPADNADVYLAARRVALSLKADQDFVINDRSAELQFMDQGVLRLSSDAARLPAERFDRPWLQYVEQALRAELFYQRDVHYVVRENKVQIVDPHTSRNFSDRTWRDGLHQAVEAKETGAITSESQPIAKIMRQKSFQLYGVLCGMSGTVLECQKELFEVYGTSVTIIPPHKPCQRIDLPTRLFVDQKSKEQAIAESIHVNCSGNEPVSSRIRTSPSSEEIRHRRRVNTPHNNFPGSK